MWNQINGKIRLARAPMINHWWQVPLYVTSRGLSTSPIPDGARTFQIDLDVIEHALQISVDDGRQEVFALQPRSVADFYAELMGRMRSLGLDVRIWTLPCEIEHPIRFEADHRHAAYDADFANRFWRVLVQADRVLTLFRAGFLGKVSPVHFFWGSFDLAVTRFSGRRAPPHPGAPNAADKVTREAYSHEVSSAGFWPGAAGLSDPVFYAYAFRRRPGSRRLRSLLPRLPTRQPLASSSCRMRRSDKLRRLTISSSNSCRALMRQRPISDDGLVPNWSARDGWMDGDLARHRCALGMRHHRAFHDRLLF
jgi:hypothetical protein